jgi:hypothetical protein
MKNKTLSGTNLPKRNLLVEIIASLLILFIVHTLVSTVIQFQSQKNMLAFYTLKTNLAAWIIVLTEGILASLLFISRTRIIGLILTSLVATMVIILIIRTPHYPHDFGGIMNSISAKHRYILYGIIVILGVIGITITMMRSNQKTENKQTPVFS